MMAQLNIKYKKNNRNYGKDQKKNQNKKILTIIFWGLLERSMARYFYKGL
jgi:hypothetical protein